MAAKSDLVIDQGTDFSVNVYIYDTNGDPVDLTDYTGESKMKKTYTYSNSYSFDVDVSNGVVTIAMVSAQTSLIPAGRYVWDCELTANDVVSRIVEGFVTVKPGVT